jgi:hypothetical protein
VSFETGRDGEPRERDSNYRELRSRFATPMSGRDLSRSSDPDDWFGELGREAPPRAGVGSDVETWIAPDERARGADGLDAEAAAGAEGSSDGLTVRLGTLLAAAAGVVVLIVVVGLALGGVFSGGSTNGITAPSTGPTVTTTETPSTSSTTTAPATRTVLPAPTTTLKPGDQGAQVKRLQRALTRLGYDAGTIDGDYGTSTEAALTRFQKASGLTADGVLGAASLRALKLALTRSTG